MGVRRAVEMVLDAPRKYKAPIYTYGPLIHNPQFISLLEEKGIPVINDIPDRGSGTILTRTHGVSPETRENLKKAGFTVIDATCPRVVRVQTIIQKHARKGYASIIIGDKDHPEVVGLRGYTGKSGYVANDIKELDSLPAFDRAIIVAQTTLNTLFFKEVKRWAARRFPHYKIFDTICDSTARRQVETGRLAELADAVIVVGGHNSGNTKRLVEIVREIGKPVYHIEAESELPARALVSAECVGITAGASTPNWIIKRVYRTLERLSFKKRQSWRNLFYTIRRSLLLTNIYISIGAGCLCYACMKLQGIEDYLPYLFISVLYVLSMHTLNNLTGGKADRYNDPDRASFYEKHKVFLTLFAVTAGGIGLATAYTMGLIPFLVLSAMSIAGLSYNLRLVPKSLTDSRYQRIRDIPGSKTVLIAVAWGVVVSVLPSLSVSGSINLNAGLVFLWSTCLVFVRTAFFDILDIQGDHIVGKETIPILIGEKQTMRLLKLMLIAIFAILLFSSLFNLFPGLGFALAACSIFMFIVLLAYERNRILPGTRLEFLVETNFVLAGIITLIWVVIGS